MSELQGIALIKFHEGKLNEFKRDVQAAARAIEKGFGRKPCFIREGGSIPIVTDFKKILGADALLLGLALPDDNPHSPNEKFSLDCFEKGMVMGAWLWQELGSLT